jgi:hypothetical protein
MAALRQRSKYCFLAAGLLFSMQAVAQTAYREATLHGRRAYVLENANIRVSALRGGGHIGEMRFLSDDPRKSINPFYVPGYQTIEPYDYDPAKHRQQYRGAFRAGYMGHLLCFPYFGPPSPDEAANGLGGHGEAAVVEWKQHRPPLVDADGVTLSYGADLPKTRYRVERTITLPVAGNIVHIEETFENLAQFDRPYSRAGHATFGMPFVEAGKTFFDTSARTGMIQVRPNHSLQSGREIRWPQGFGRDERPVDLRGMQTLPQTNTFYALAADSSIPLNYFTVYSTDYPVLVGFLLPTADHDWIVDWQSNQDGRWMRGIEFGTTPFDEGLRKSVERGKLLGVPSYGWIAARAKLKVRYSIFLAEIPTGFKGVQSVEHGAGELIVTERETGRRIAIAAKPRLD